MKNLSSSNNTHFLQCIGRPTGPLFWSGFCAICVFLGIPASLLVLWELLQRRQRGVFNDIFMLNLSFIDLTFMCIGRPTGPLFWSGFCAICVFLGIPASLLVLWELLQRRRRRVFNDIFMLNLSFIDLTFMVMLVLIVYNYMLLHSLPVVDLGTFIHSLPLCGRPLFMACVCGDCYFAVVYPIEYKTSKNGAMIRKVACLTVWLLTVFFGLFLRVENEEFITPLTSVPLTGALPIITFCDISILQALRKPAPNGNGNIHPQKKRALHTIINSFTMTFTAYLPPLIFFSFSDVLPLSKEEYFCTLTFYGLCFCTAGCVIMPALCLESLGTMHRFKELLRKR
ncbi:atypical chemokine receptor 3-like [Salminus brasiliensis]|uniref:atypical chemokine receptor 3-like n=1 Tax=Salminus brasiliensis TaxID=930266 RepID=UPI003B8326B1